VLKFARFGVIGRSTTLVELQSFDVD